MEAKSYSYDGDDWGDVDDYDEYGGYDEPVQAKPTGLRQQGQTVWSRNASGYNAVNRSNSFDQGDEGQAFSAGGPQQYSNPSPYDLETNQAVQSQRNQGYAQEQPQHQQPYSSGPPAGSIQSKSSMEGQMALGHTHPPPANYRGVSYSDQPRQPGNNSRSQSMTSNTSSLDFHGRRDFTPSAMPPPLHTRASPAPQDPSEFIPPPRKSSLSQQKIRHTPTAGDNAPNAQEQGPYSNNTATSSIRDSEESNPSKPLPFVRPADIYRRMQEEREKERQSQESSRPSMNAIMNEQPPVPDSRGTPAEEQSRMDNSMGPSLGRKKSFETDKGELGSRRLNSSLQPVAERKSEYGMDDRPLLPDVTRISGFGESFLNTVGNEVTESQRSNSRNTNEPQTSMSPIHRNTEDLSLRNQPSLGFRSVVHQAFDRQDDQIPQTPSSLSGSAVARSNSESTNGISPIISRAPSTTNAEVRAREAEAREANIPRIIEEPGEAASRRSSSNTLGTAKSVTRKAHPSQSPRHDSSNSVPTSFIPGHRRDISTPSPDNSPARTPALEASSQLRQPQEAELAVTTPIEPNMSDRSFPSDAISYGEQRPSMPYDGYSEAQPPPVTRSGTAGKSMVDVQNPSKIDTTINATQEPMSPLRSFNQPGSSVTFFDSPTGRAESPSKSKVRDLAGKFEGVAGSRHGSEQSLPLPISMSSSIPKLEDPFIPRPGNDRMQSFRPHLPGGWESYASNAPVRQGTPLMSEGTISTRIPMKADHVKVEGRDVSHVPNEDIDITPTTDKRTPSESPQKEEPENPFSAVATAGSALAGALVAAMGMNQDKPSPQPEDFNRPRGRSASSKDAEVHPEAFRPSHTAVDDSVSSVEPTPLAKNTPQSLGQSPTSNPDYFPPVVPLRAKPRNILTQEDEPARPVRPQFLPSLSTDPSPQDYESDRLRKEIVRELSPHAEQFEDTQSYNTSAPQVRPSRLSVNQAFKGHGHDSIALPSEYESYWNGSTSEDEASRPTSQQVPDTSVNARVPEPPKHDSEFARHISNETEPSASSSDRLQVRPAALVHRFSWEPEPEEINAQQQPLLQAGRDIASEGQIGDAPEISSSPVIQPPEQPVVNEDPPVKTRQALGISPVEEALYGTIPPAPIEEALRSSVSQHSEMRPHTAGSESHGRNEHMPAEDRYNIWPSAEQKNNQIQGDIDTPTPTNRIELPLPPLPQNAQTKIPAFREILALKTAQERIQTYNATREQFANMNTGLEDWMTATLDELPEHAALVNNGGQFTAGAYSHKPSLSRGKLAGLRISSLQPLQQPYYQQYLNASSQPTGSSPATGGPTTPGNASSHPHAGSSGGKLSSHHVQAKGKDLLQSAGKFGGKANVAAKGLFSKGKSKFRGAGGGDKVDS